MVLGVVFICEILIISEGAKSAQTTHRGRVVVDDALANEELYHPALSSEFPSNAINNGPLPQYPLTKRREKMTPVDAGDSTRKHSMTKDLPAYQVRTSIDTP